MKIMKKLFGFSKYAYKYSVATIIRTRLAVVC